MTENTNCKNHNKKNLRNILIVVILVVLISILGYLFLHNKANNTNPKNSAKSINDTLRKQKSTLNQKDSVVNIDNQSIDADEESEPYGSFIYVGNGLNLGGKKLKYGDAVFVDYSKSKDDDKIIYLSNPYMQKNLQFYKLSGTNLIDESTFESYKKNFSLVPFTTLPSSAKDIILESNYNNGNTYYITQNEERAKSTICMGDFDGDGIKDVAVLLDNNEKQISRLLVICTNATTKKPYIGFAENYSDKMRIKSFKKNALIIINSELQPAILDGMILQGEDVKLAILYDKDLQKFKTYYQE